MKYCKNCEQTVEPKRHFNVAILFILLLLGIIPGIIYYIIVGKSCPMCNSNNWGLKKDKGENPGHNHS
jgi:hypothetical protein